MVMSNSKFIMATGLENLRIYKCAQELEKHVHNLTNSFPSDERFKMIDQMRRSSSSVVNNIAEAYGKYNFGQKLQSTQIARGEAYEIRSQVESVVTKKYLSEAIANKLLEDYTVLIKGISAYIKFLRTRRESSTNSTI